MARQKDPNATDIKVGEKIRLQRLMRHLSQTDLASRIGLTFQQVQKYEKGVNRVSAGRLKQIADIFRLPISFFFDGAAENGDEAKYINTGLGFLETAASVRLVRAFAAIESAKVRRDILTLVEGMVRKEQKRANRPSRST